ncbi:NlpC/P60 family protein [Aeromonas simiae]|uniref:Peptidase P60 n=1 Tax=Aeromonas simiae TaxID=218936 RepID=A0A5J6WSW9_9GAMM|nr:NlpC/P60 family protein [Aeromonas simiae]QFI53982.1 peptidase P60 [Aeromonas simiae]
MRYFLLCGVTLLLAACSSTPDQAPPPTSRNQAFDGFYQQWRGVPYRMGGNSRAGLDCSAFTQLAYQQVFGLSLPRTTTSQANLGQPITRSQLRHGDLVFFKTGWNQYHVGVYTGAGEFIHASTSKGVIRSRLDNVYWRKHYWQARRMDPILLMVQQSAYGS